MLQRLDILDRSIAETEVRVVEQILLVLRMEAMGQDATAARKMLRIVEDLLAEYHRARELVIEAREMTGRETPAVVPKPCRPPRPLT